MSSPCPAEPQALAALASRLTNPSDREAYGDVLMYFNSLPPDDELFRLARMLGYTALLAEHIPDAVGELLNEIRAQTQAVREFRDALDERLAAIPGDIAGNVDLSAVGRALAESIRQSAGAELLELRTLATETTEALRPLRQQYHSVTGQIASQLGRFSEVSLELQEETAELRQRDRRRGPAFLWVAGGLIFLLGVLLGVFLCRFLK